MTCRVNPVQLQVFGQRRRVECVWRFGARGQCCRRRVLARAGMHDIGFSPVFHLWIPLFFLYTMVCLKTRFENFDFWVWIKHPFFQEQALIPIVIIFQKSNTHKFMWFGNLPTDTTKRFMSSPKCRSVEVINNPARPGSNHMEVNCINYS